MYADHGKSKYSKGLSAGPIFKITACVFFSILLLVGCGGKNKSIVIEEGGGEINELMAPPVIRDYIIGPEDEISITVFGHRELEMKVRVGPSGDFYYPLLGYLDVEGMSSKELRSFLTEKISKYYVDPHVGISIVGARSQKIFVLGEVRQPGIYPLSYPLTAFEIVLRAGGFNDRAKKSSIMLVRGMDTEAEIRKLDLESVYKEGINKDNVYLQGGDIIYVPQNIVTNVEDFIQHLSIFMRPLIETERAVILWPNFIDVLDGTESK
jgi:polysaccharide export outer membrane protein